MMTIQDTLEEHATTEAKATYLIKELKTDEERKDKEAHLRGLLRAMEGFVWDDDFEKPSEEAATQLALQQPAEALSNLLAVQPEEIEWY